MDFQTKFGKSPYGVSRHQEVSKPVFACAGYIGKDVDVLYEEGMTAILEFYQSRTIGSIEKWTS